MLETEQGKHIKTVFNSKPYLVSGVGIVQKMSQKPNREISGKEQAKKLQAIEVKQSKMFKEFEEEWRKNAPSLKDIAKFYKEALKRR